MVFDFIHLQKLTFMKELVLSDIHKSLGAKMVDFAGYNMPIQYEGVKAEHNFVREHVGVFDVSHMGEIYIKGKNSLKFLQFLTANDVSKLNPGRVQYTYLPNKQGGVIDDCLLYMIDKEEYLLVVNASNIHKVFDWLNQHNHLQCNIVNESENISLLAVQGPETIKLLDKVTNINLNNIKYYHFQIGSIANIDNVIVSRTGYTGELGFELYVSNDFVKQLWKSILETDIMIKPIGLAARDTLRLEKGYCLYGNEINDNMCPIEAGLDWVTKFSKDFINCNQLKSRAEGDTKYKLIGIEMIDKGIARKDYTIHNCMDQEIGKITSGTMSPTLNKPIAMGYILKESVNLTDDLFVLVRGKKLKAKIVKIPFV